MRHEPQGSPELLTRCSASLNRREFLASLGIGGAGLVAATMLPACSPAAAPSPPADSSAMPLPSAPKPGNAPGRSGPPNVIVIVGDDFGYGDTSIYGRKEAPTPNMEAMARNGVKFTSGYVSAPLCSPSRAAFITGRYQQRFGFEFNAGAAARAVRDGLGLPTSEKTLADVLKAAGYVTGIVGKWHLGAQPQLFPTKRGFDEFFGFLHGANIYVEPADAPGVHSVAGAEGEAPTGTVRDALNAIYRGTDVVKEPDYLTDAFTREALSFIDHHAQVPFFLYLPYNAVHEPLMATDKYYAKFGNIASESARIYAAMVSALDDGIGAVLQKLRDKGLENDTLVFYFGDNGATGNGSNEPLVGQKLFPFEGGIRTPFIAQWSGHIRPGQVFDQPICARDIFPTALAAAGLTAPRELALDGVNLLPYLTGSASGSPHDVLFWRLGDNLALRKGNWKYVSLNRKYRFLFDLSSSPRERTDLSAKAPDVFKELERDLAEWETRLVAPLWGPRSVIPVPLRLLGLGEGTFNLYV